MERNWLLPSLQEISLHKLAQGLFYHHLNDVEEHVQSLDKISLRSYETEDVCNKACNFVDQQLYIPSSLTLPLKKQIISVAYQVDDWIDHFVRGIRAFSYVDESMLHFLPNIVWSSDGFIDYKKTAVVALRYLKFTPLKKYRYICLYCMEDEIENFWSINQTDICYEKIFGHFTIEHYWMYVKKNAFPLLNRHYTSYYIVILLEYLQKSDFVAVEYFWNLLNFDDQFQNIPCCFCPKTLTCWLQSLNKTNLKKVFTEKLRYILDIYTEYRSYAKYIFCLWVLVEHFITGDEFVTLLLHLRRSVNKDFEDENLTTSLLIDIWRSSSSELKNYIFEYNSGSCIYNICKVMERDMNDQVRDNRLVWIILSDASPEFRQVFMQNKCVKSLIKS